MQKKTRKSQGTHSKEIQDFQKYIEIVYDLTTLISTVVGVVRELKRKLLQKLLELNFLPSCYW